LSDEARLKEQRKAAAIDLAVYLVAVAAIGGGVAVAASAAHAAIVAGGILLVTLFASRVRIGGRP
jgi:hypothetical protein